MEPTGTAGSDNKTLGSVVQIGDGRIQAHLDQVVRAAVEETLNALREAEAEEALIEMYLAEVRSGGGGHHADAEGHTGVGFDGERSQPEALPSDREVATMLKAIRAQEDAQAAREKAQQVVEKLKVMKLARAAEIVSAGVEETLSYYAMLPEHWRCYAPQIVDPEALFTTLR